MIPGRSWLAGYAIICVAYPLEAQLDTAREVRSLSLEKAESSPPVGLTGVVIFSDPPSTVFIQDETAGTFFRLDSRTAPRPGDEVKVNGQAFPGLYLPGIEEATFEVLSHPGLPGPIPVSYDDLMSGKFHYQRVTVEGIVRTIAPQEEAGSLVRIALGSRILEVRVEQPPLEHVMPDSRVSIAGLAAGHINARRQLVEPYLRCADWTEFKVVEAARSDEAIPKFSSDELLNFAVDGHGGHRVRMEGIVLAAFPGGRLYLRDGESAISVQLLVPYPQVEPGHRLAITGFPEMSGFSASLADASVIDRQKGGEVPDPNRISTTDLMTGIADGDLVSIKAELVDAFRTGSGGVLTLQDEGVTIQAKIPEIPEDLAPGSSVEVTGIFLVETTRGSSYNSRPETVSLRTRSIADLRVIDRPDWWTPQRLAVAAIGLLFTVAMAGLWIGMLRRQVAHQTLALRETIEHEATLEERQRIAREFHDTLEQELAGLSLRLDAAVAHGAQEKLAGLLEDSRKLVSRIQTETRNLVSDLRDTSGGSADLEAALQELVESQPRDIGPKLSLDTQNVPEISPRTVHHLKMIAREAIANALKHSGADKIDLRVVRSGDSITMEIADNGKGFDSSGKTRGMPGHFGCMGIRERGERLGAIVEWQSGPDKGTTVSVRMSI